MVDLLFSVLAEVSTLFDLVEFLVAASIPRTELNLTLHVSFQNQNTQK